MLSTKVTQWLQGNTDAIDLILSFHQIAETWDDLIDKDNPVSQITINKTFYIALVAVPRNAFYREHFDLLSPIVELAIFDWHTANTFEATKEHLETAFGLRCTSQLLTVMCARIIGGVEWAKHVNTEFRSAGETWDEYIKDIHNGRLAR